MENENHFNQQEFIDSKQTKEHFRDKENLPFPKDDKFYYIEPYWQSFLYKLIADKRFSYTFLDKVNLSYLSKIFETLDLSKIDNVTAHLLKTKPNQIIPNNILLSKENIKIYGDLVPDKFQVYFLNGIHEHSSLQEVIERCTGSLIKNLPQKYISEKIKILYDWVSKNSKIKSLILSGKEAFEKLLENLPNEIKILESDQYVNKSLTQKIPWVDKNHLLEKITYNDKLDSHCNISLTQGDKKLDFNSLLPPGSKFRKTWCENEKGAWKMLNFEPHRYVITYGDLDQEHSLLMLLHEIAHLQLEEEGRPGYKDKERDEFTIAEERQGWARTIRLLRNLEKQGYRILRSPKTNKEILAETHLCLLSHALYIAEKG